MTYGDLRCQLLELEEELKQYDYYAECPPSAAAWLAKLVMEISGLDNESLD